jgi:putative membrane protein
MLSTVLVLVVAALHAYFLVLEMFLWRRPLGLKTFRMSPEKAETTAQLAMNQGLYNGFLAAGLVWGLVREDRGVLTFFLACVIAAGLFGGATVSKRIVLVQALPAAIALAAVWI